MNGTNIAGEFLLLLRRADGMGQGSCSWDSAAAPSLLQSQLCKMSLHLLLQALQGDTEHSQAAVTFELLSQCSAFLQVC